MTKIIRSSEINIIARLLSEQEMLLIVLGPVGSVLKDDENNFELCSAIEDVKDKCRNRNSQKVCVINAVGEQLVLPEADFIIEFNSRNKYGESRRIKWDYICNPDGSFRWLFPRGARRPLFLSFYNFTYWKAACYKTLVRLVYFLRIPQVLSNGTLLIYARGISYIEQLIPTEVNTDKDYSIFSGTAGMNRKIILAEARGGHINSFHKIALSGKSKENVNNEYSTLQELSNSDILSEVIPRAVVEGENAIRVSNIKPGHSFTEYLFGNAQANFLDALYETGNVRKRFKDLPFCKSSSDRLGRIKNHPRFGKLNYSGELYNKLFFLQTFLEKRNNLITVGRNHGDFTRWNMYQDLNRIYVYDWELSKMEMPLLHDLFHFVIQVAIFSVRADVSEIERRLAAALEMESVKKIILKYAVDPLLHLQMYLLENTGYYLELYLDQAGDQKNIDLQLRTWNCLLFSHTSYKPAVSQRKEFIGDFFGFMLDTDYVVLKNSGKSVDNLSEESDIDLLISKSDLRSILIWIKGRQNIHKYVCTQKSFMTTVQIYFMDSSFLSIDLLNAFNRKSLEYLNADICLGNSIVRDGIKIPEPAYDYLYIYIFYQINYAKVPEKYGRHFTGISGFQEFKILHELNAQFGITAKSIKDTFEFNAANRSKILSFLKDKKANTYLRRLTRAAKYLIGELSFLFNNRGFMLTFSGVDGAGKSTILQEVRDLLEKKYRRKVVVIRHRPSMLPILSAWKYGRAEADKKCVESLPRKGNNDSRLSSLLRFAYYYADYLFGQVVIYLKYSIRGYVVLYDRYYFDFIVDAKRSNIIVSSGFIKSLFRFIYKPELNVFLYAKPEVILLRKKELSADDIGRLTTGYRDLFEELGNSPRFMCIENIDKKETLDKIERAFIELN